MSRGKKGTCNYKMMTFRINLENLKYLNWREKYHNISKGISINRILEWRRIIDGTYQEETNNQNQKQ